MKNLLFAIAMAPIILSLTGCGKKTTVKTEPEYTVSVEVDQPENERVSGVMQPGQSDMEYWGNEK